MPKLQECLVYATKLLIGEYIFEYVVVQSNIYNFQIKDVLKISSKATKVDDNCKQGL